MWTCPKCHAKVEPAYEVCWRCGTSPEGVEDPSFVRADEAGPIETAPLILGRKPGSDAKDALTTEFAGPGAADLVECYLARLSHSRSLAGTASLCAAILGIVLIPLIILTELFSGPPSAVLGYYLLTLLVVVILELVAFGFGIAGKGARSPGNWGWGSQ